MTSGEAGTPGFHSLLATAGAQAPIFRVSEQKRREVLLQYIEVENYGADEHSTPALPTTVAMGPGAAEHWKVGGAAKEWGFLF